MTPKEISTAVRNIERDRSEFLKNAMYEYDRDVYSPALKSVRLGCAHTFKFHSLGPVQGVWKLCTTCKLSKWFDE